jgi:exodeoxyribonuclease V gamma subunit
VLHLHRGERADVLASGLAALLAGGEQDPFAAEIVCVPSRGVERWLTQQLSLVLGARAGGFDGVCANVEFPGPGRLISDVVAGVSGIDPRSDPWRPGRSVWPLLELLESAPAAVRRPADLPGGRPYAAARHVAGLFDTYESYRPSMIVDWAGGNSSDGVGEPLDDDLCWQADLWRSLRTLVGAPSPAERLGPACERLREAPEAAAALPGRLSLFGLTRLPPGQLAVLSALAEHRDIHLWLLHPCAPLWERLAGSGEAVPGRRSIDPTASLVSHRLLSSMGRDVRELQLTLAGAGNKVDDVHHPLPDGTAGDLTLLRRLQEAIRSDEPVEAVVNTPRPVLAAGDRSIQVHACHGRARQVDVLRDVILGLLAADPTLEPRDIVVMCPDIETFAPLISATFGVGAELVEQEASESGSASPASLLRVRLADRSLRQTNPVMSVAATLLELVDGRMTASEVLDLAAAAPVRRRFGFDDDDLGRLTEWVAEAQVRWGLDAAHRAAFKLEAFPQNTWEAGLDRLLLGVAMADGPASGDAAAHPRGAGWVGLALPLDDVDSTDIELVGRLAELVERLHLAVDALQGPQILAEWISRLAEAVESLTLTTGSDQWQAAQLRTELSRVLDAAGERAAVVTLSLGDLRSLLADRLRGRPTRANFRTGSLTMCTLVPMRSVPHRVVCLMGLDDGAFPRQPAVDGDDILLRDPMTGERDERSEDRQLLLDAILAARERLVITYAGADERTNATRPPAVPVGELLDTLEAAYRSSDGTALRRQLLTRHPLQPFDPANFAPGALGVSAPFSFDPTALGGARAMAAPRRVAEPYLAEPLPAAPVRDLELESLRSFFEHPVRGFLRQRLGVTLPRSEDEASDRLPVHLDTLARWQIGQRMLDARLSGVDPLDCRQAEWRRGALPPGRLGGRVLDEVASEVEQIVADARGWRQGEPRVLDLAIELEPGRRLTGTVSGVFGQTLVHTSFGQVNHKRRFRAWLMLLLLAAGRRAEEFAAVAVGRKGQVAMGPVEGAAAAAHLRDLVGLYELGLREPLPMASKSSFEYAAARGRGAAPEEAVKAALKGWEGPRWGGECQDAEHEHVYGVRPPFRVLLESQPQPGDGAEWPDEPTRFGVLSRRWWGPMLAGEFPVRA